MSYIGTQPTQLTLETRQEFTASYLQKTFDTNQYTVGYVDCYLNGVKLSTSDFTANNGNQVVLGTGAAAGDILAVVMKKPDHYPLPITDSAGNNVLSESAGVVTLAVDGLTVDGAGSFSTNLSIRTTSSPSGYNLHIGQDDSDKSLAKFTNTTTGTTTSDGFDVGINAAEEALIFHNENKPIIFGTNGTPRMRIDSSGNLLFNSGYGSVATAYACRAWVNFNGTGTVAIRDSGNVSSITDNGTGIYTVNFTTAMPDANYATPTSISITTSGGAGSQQGNLYVNSHSTTSYQILAANSGTFNDMGIVTSAVFR